MQVQIPGPDSGTRSRVEAIISMSIFLTTLEQKAEIAISLHLSPSLSITLSEQF